MEKEKNKPAVSFKGLTLETVKEKFSSLPILNVFKSSAKADIKRPDDAKNLKTLPEEAPADTKENSNGKA